MVTKVSLKQLYIDTFRRSTLIAIPGIEDLLVVEGSKFTEWEIFYSIVRDALKTYEYYYPLTLNQKIYLEIDAYSRSSTITGNFTGYLNGAVEESQIVIVPAAIVGMCTSFYTASTYPLRNFRYNPPVITDCWYSTGIYYCNSICKRPFFEEYNEVTKEPTDKCAVYYMNRDTESAYSIFYDEVYLSLCRYLMNIKKNMTLQNMPIELFQGLEEDYNNINTQQQQIYSQALTQSFWII